MTHGRELLPFGAAQCDTTLTCLPFVTQLSSKKTYFLLTGHQLCEEHIILPLMLFYFLNYAFIFVIFPFPRPNQSDRFLRMKVCIQIVYLVRARKIGGGETVNLLFSLGLNWCVVFTLKLSETLQVQTPAVPPGPCHPPRLVGKPKAREVQLRWGESFRSN